MRITLAEAIRRGLVPPSISDSHTGQQFDSYTHYLQIPLSDLAHVETLTSGTRCKKLPLSARDEPIRLSDGDTGRLVLRDGNHRLRLARERGDTTITGIITSPKRPTDG